VVIMALGFDVSGLPWLADTGIYLGRWGEVVIDPATGRSSHPKVFAGGDCQRGADLAVTAAADGRRAALAIIDQLLG
jgi:glutamate synthase (NADPH/NADH) small chain